LLTDVYVDGQGPFAFVIDTASSRTLIYEHVRARLGLAQSSPQLLTIYGINNIGTALPVRPKQVQVAGEAISNLLVGVLPDSNTADDPDGVLGIDALARYFVVLDRAQMRFKLLSPGSDAGRDYGDWAQVPLTPHPLKNVPINFWYVRARYNEASIITLFDLGAGITMLNWNAAEMLGVRKHDFQNLHPPDTLRDVLGTDAPAVRLNGLTISLPGTYWRHQMVLVSGAPVFGYFDLDETPAAIAGPGLFHDNSLAMDFQNHRLFVGPIVEQRQSSANGGGVRTGGGLR
jgi:predicted aspartyl protease